MLVGCWGGVRSGGPVGAGVAAGTAGGGCGGGVTGGGAIGAAGRGVAGGLGCGGGYGFLMMDPVVGGATVPDGGGAWVVAGVLAGVLTGVFGETLAVLGGGPTVYKYDPILYSLMQHFTVSG